jgi:hypothetical protein
MAKIPSYRTLAVLLTFFATCSASGRAANQTKDGTFRIHGTARDFDGSSVAGAEVSLQGDKVSKLVTTDLQGNYALDLPFGSYTRIARKLLGSKVVMIERRPLFHVSSHRDITLNINFALDPSCDMLTGATEEQTRSSCGSLDYYSVPSKDGIPFQILVAYSPDVPGGLKSRTSVAYNLFTMSADRVTYDQRTRNLRAAGSVVVESVDGTTEHADSMAFQIENGVAVRTP